MYDSLLWKSANPPWPRGHACWDGRCLGTSRAGTAPAAPRGGCRRDSPAARASAGPVCAAPRRAAYALQNPVYVRAQVLGVDDGLCAQARDDCTRGQKEGRKAFVDWARLDEDYKDVKPPGNTINRKWEKSYHEGTPDEHTFVLQLLDGASSFDETSALGPWTASPAAATAAMTRTPLNPKFGGRWVRGNYNYQ